MPEPTVFPRAVIGSVEYREGRRHALAMLSDVRLPVDVGFVEVVSRIISIYSSYILESRHINYSYGVLSVLDTITKAVVPDHSEHGRLPSSVVRWLIADNKRLEAEVAQLRSQKATKGAQPTKAGGSRTKTTQAAEPTAGHGSTFVFSKCPKSAEVATNDN